MFILLSGVDLQVHRVFDWIVLYIEQFKTREPDYNFKYIKI
jgi:hypothetical protein